MRFHVDRARLVELWRTEMTNEAIAAELGITQVQLYVAGRRFKLEQRWGHVRRVYKPSDPSESEIRERAAEIRASWTPEEAERRLVGNIAESWTPPMYEFAQGILVRAR